MKELGVPKVECVEGATQGFINTYLKSLDRTEAYYVALRNGQCKEKKNTGEFYCPDLAVDDSDWKPILASEDLW